MTTDRPNIGEAARLLCGAALFAALLYACTVF